MDFTVCIFHGSFTVHMFGYMLARLNTCLPDDRGEDQRPCLATLSFMLTGTPAANALPLASKVLMLGEKVSPRE